LLGGEDLEGRSNFSSFSLCFEGDNKIRSSSYWGKKCTHRENHGYAYVHICSPAFAGTSRA